MRSLSRSVVLTVLIAWAGQGAQSAPRSEAQRLLAMSSNWAYQLQGLDAAELSRTLYDVAVIDWGNGGAKPAVQKLKQKPTGGRRLLLSYLSIGEAEVYRYYWSQCCARGQRPAWIGTENQRWKGNYRVQFWDPEWKAIIFDDESSYLKRIIDAGFDGVYLDRIDVHAEVSGDGVEPRKEMIRFVQELAAKARSLKPEFLIVAQNAEELLADDAYLTSIDGIAKEDLLYGVAGEGRRNKDAMIHESSELLRRAAEHGKHVMVVEYLQSAVEIGRARTEIMELGFVPYFAPRQLQKLQVENLESDGSH